VRYRNFGNEEAMAHWGAIAKKKKEKKPTTTYIYI